MRVSREIVRPLLSLLWLLVVPLGAAIAYWLAEKSWLQQETNRIYLWSAGAAIAWLAGATLVVSISVPRTPRLLAAGLVWGIVAGAAIGNTALTLINCAGYSSPGETVTVRIVRDARFRVHLRVVDGQHAGLQFSCGKSAWNLRDDRPRAFVMHRGRLGLWWGRPPS